MAELIFKIEANNEEKIKEVLIKFATQITQRGTIGGIPAVTSNVIEKEDHLILEINSMGFKKGVSRIYKPQIRAMVNKFDPEAKIYYKEKDGSYTLLQKGEGIGGKIKKKFGFKGKSKKDSLDSELN